MLFYRLAEGLSPENQLEKKLIVLKTNAQNSKEKEYIANVIFKEFLGLAFRIKWEEIKNYKLVLANGKQLIIEDHFFNKFPEEKAYLKIENIPEEVKWAENDFLAEKNIPAIFGNEKLEVTENIIVCGIDIFASAFFMLTRWEEYVNKTRDEHDRFPASASLAYKNNFLDRPVVNEYVEILWRMMKQLDPALKRKERKPLLLLTHDVDRPFQFTSCYSGLKVIFDDLVKRRSLSSAVKKLITKIGVHFFKKKDTFDTFDFLMSQSEKMNLHSYFFFKGTGTSSYDRNYDMHSPEIQKIIQKIKARGHFIGFHPGYNAYNDEKQFANEKQQLEVCLEKKLTFGRQHFLRFDAPFTWQIWEKQSMLWDSTLGYADKEGFRCGVCYDYPVFDFLQMKQLKLREKPLIVMEGSLLSYQYNLDSKQIADKIKKLMEIVCRYRGIFVLLWHNSSLTDKKEKELYKNVLNSWLIINKS